MKKTITVIPATKTNLNQGLSKEITQKRVAGYARVSTGTEEQQNSYNAQVKYYTEYIQSNPDWQFVDVYADEGVSATSTKRRQGFNRMIADSLDGKIDLILTKSVSRFARNTVDSLTNVRKLKEKGVEVFFEKENIWTMDSKGELLITILSSLAEEESRSISQNVTWGIRKRFAEGKVSLPYAHFLGYDRGEDGLPKINEEQAVTVRLIYRLFLEGKTPHAIAKLLTEKEILSPAGKEKWHQGTVRSILTNEKMKGEACLQKRYTVDFLTKKQKINEGEAPQFRVLNSHPWIISPHVYEMVQEEFRRRKEAGNYTSSATVLSGRIVCGECGGFYGRKVWHAGSKYETQVWHCGNKFAKRTYCETPTLKEEDIKAAFTEAFNRLIENKDEIFENYDEILDTITDDSSYQKELKEIDAKAEELEDAVKGLVYANARMEIEKKEFDKQYKDSLSRHGDLRKRREELKGEIDRCAAKRMQVKGFLAELKKQDALLVDFDEQVWQATLHHVTVGRDGKAAFVFRDGTECAVTVKGSVKRNGTKKKHP